MDAEPASSSSFRIESDFLGEKPVPADAYYGIQTLRAVENFPITGYRLHRELIIALALVKKAAAIANRETNRLEPELGLAIEQAADEVVAGQWHEQFVVDPIQGGAGTSINMNMNEVLCNRAIELLGGVRGDYSVIRPNTHVNMSQSTNDCVPTAAHIAALRLADELLAEMHLMHDEFVNKANQFDGVIKIGRTHLQDAVPIRMGQGFEAYARVVARDMERIARAKHELYEINMGATAIGTGLNADPRCIGRVVDLLGDMTGFPLRRAEHLPDATQNTDAYTGLSAALKVCMINMSKIASDLRLMASGPRAGFGEIRLPPRQPGSSIMPGKVNPVMCELVNQVAFQVIGNDNTIGLASEAGQLELNVMQPVLVYNLLQSLDMMKRTFGVFRSYCLEGIEPQAERCRAHVERSAGLMTALNPYLGYETSARIAYEAIRSGKSVRELVLRDHLLDEKRLDAVLDPYRMTTPGIPGEI